MKNFLSRRQLISGMSAFGGVMLSGCDSETYIPPNYGSLFGLSDSLTMSVQRLLLSGQPLAREFNVADISKKFPAIGTVLPEGEIYRTLLENHFEGWNLTVGGLVDHTLSLSLAELKSLPARTQITAHSCERGWTAIGQWTGVPLAELLTAAGMKPEARYVVFECTDGWYESIDMFDALHPQTILAYGMNGGELPVQHGAPLRLRVERHLGYKSVKYVQNIQVVASLKDIRSGKGSLPADYGYSWYAGI